MAGFSAMCENVRMKPHPHKPTPHPEPAVDGNPAYPSLDEREKIVEAHKKNPEEVKKIPADFIKDFPPEDKKSA